jgi:uncharacterized coiled-coil protein SlyX
MRQERKNLLTSRRRGIGTVAVIGLCGGLAVLTAGLWMVQHSQINKLNADRAANAAELDRSRLQIQDLTNRLNTLAQRQAQSADRAEERPPVRPSPPAKRAPRVAKSDPRLDRLQGQLTETEKQLASTRDDLAKAQESLDGKINSTRDDLNGSIAKTHEDVAALQRRGEQNIYEFRLTKSKQMQRVGPLSLALRSTSTKHKTYDFSMLVDDNTLSKKHVNLYEPVWITVSDRPQPVQLVVNHVGKDEVDGYVSEPKYKKSELATNAETPAPAPAKELTNR